jgi:sec-independent protein translocase protein TatA
MIPGFHGLDLLVILVVALLIFGPKRLPEMGSAIGKSIKEFRKGMAELTAPKEAKEEEPEPAPAPAATNLEAIDQEIASKKAHLEALDRELANRQVGSEVSNAETRATHE